MKILLIGPQPNPITGLSLANNIVLKYLPKYTDYQVDSIDTNYQSLKENIGTFSLKKSFHYIKQYKQLFKIRKSDKVYITIGQTFFGVLKYYPYFLLARLLKKEIIIHLHGNHLWKEYEDLKGVKKKVFHKILSMSDKGIVLSQSLEKNLIPFLKKDKIYILENFVEDFLYENQIEKKFDKLRIIYLSNLMQEKGIIEFLEALQKLNEKNIIFEARIAGGIDESMKPTINSYFNKLEDNVQYLGLVHNEQKKELLVWGNVFILPTKFDEGQPISILEAMATGNIILTTKRGGIVDIFINEINGFYIETHSSTSIVNTLIKVNNSLVEYKKISEHNFLEAKSKYQVKNFIKKLDTILKD